MFEHEKISLKRHKTIDSIDQKCKGQGWLMGLDSEPIPSAASSYVQIRSARFPPDCFEVKRAAKSN